jgi:hypothetical protein
MYVNWPPLHLDTVPDERIEGFFNELIRSETTLELMVGIYSVAKPELIRSLRKHLMETNPLVDHPTCRVLRFILMEEEEMLEWGEQAVRALTLTEEDRISAQKWQGHLSSFLYAAGGISGDLEKPHDWTPSKPAWYSIPNSSLWKPTLCSGILNKDSCQRIQENV